MSIVSDYLKIKHSYKCDVIELWNNAIKQKINVKLESEVRK